MRESSAEIITGRRRRHCPVEAARQQTSGVKTTLRGAREGRILRADTQQFDTYGKTIVTQTAAAAPRNSRAGEEQEPVRAESEFQSADAQDAGQALSRQIRSEVKEQWSGFSSQHSALGTRAVY